MHEYDHDSDCPTHDAGVCAGCEVRSSFNPDCLTFSLLELSLKKLALKFGKSWSDLDDFKRIFWKLRSPVAGEGAHSGEPAHSGADVYLKVEGDKCQRKSESPKKTKMVDLCARTTP